MVLAPIKSPLFTGVAIIKSDLPIIFVVAAGILSPLHAHTAQKPQRMNREWLMRAKVQ